MGRKGILQPEEKPQGCQYGCLVTLLVLAALSACFAYLTERWWVLLSAVPPAAVALLGAYSEISSWRKRLALLRSGIYGIVVTSDSPHWHDYMRQTGCPVSATGFMS